MGFIKRLLGAFDRAETEAEGVADELAGLREDFRVIRERLRERIGADELPKLPKPKAAK